MRGFGSDNHSGVHPRILKAIAEANVGHQPSYETDPLSERCHSLFKTLFGEKTESFFVFNGTAANVLALSQLVKPHQTVLTSTVAHINVDECGAPEKFIGARVVGLETPDGKLTPEAIKPYLIRRGDQHFSQIKAISITQSSELGCVYRPEEIRALSDFAKSENLFLHMDGARLVNAAAALGLSLKALTTDCGVDALSLGGTKNGLLFGEAVIFPHPELAKDFKYVRKQAMQLPSKARFLAAQFLEFLGTDLWIENARHANAMAQRLFVGLQKSPLAKVSRTPEANAVFAVFPKHLIARLKEVAFFYVWDEKTYECRLVTTWDTTESDVDGFINALIPMLTT